MASSEARSSADSKGAQEIARDLESLRNLAARFRHLAPTAQEHVLRAILGKREALLESISTRLSQASQAATGADVAVPSGDAPPRSTSAETPPAAHSTSLRAALSTAERAADNEQRKAFAETLGEVAALDREAESVLRKRADEAVADIQKLRAGKKWRQSEARWT